MNPMALIDILLVLLLFCHHRWCRNVLSRKSFFCLKIGIVGEAPNNTLTDALSRHPMALIDRLLVRLFYRHRWCPMYLLESPIFVENPFILETQYLEISLFLSLKIGTVCEAPRDGRDPPEGALRQAVRAADVHGGLGHAQTALLRTGVFCVFHRPR